MLFLGTQQGAAQAPLRSRDFVVNGVYGGMDSSQIVRRLGKADSVTYRDHPYSVGSKLANWWYPTLRLTNNGGATVDGVWITAVGPKTARGLRVGDSRRRVRQLYGKPSSADSAEDSWVYTARGGDDLHLIKIFFAKGRVESIFLGWVLD